MGNPFRVGSTFTLSVPPCVVVIFGATGDLTHRRLVPALYNLAVDGLLPANFSLVAFARRDYTHEKLREEWRLGRLLVTLDHTPMGDFVEIEGPEDELAAAAAGLGLDPALAAHGSYLSLWQAYRADHPELDLPVDMVFRRR